MTTKPDLANSGSYYVSPAGLNSTSPLLASCDLEPLINKAYPNLYVA